MLLDDLARLAIEALRGADVERGDDPGHEELRKREEISEVDRTEDALSP